jgi:hypothetical protein
VLDKRLEEVLLIERTNQRRNHIHQLEALLFHVISKQTSCTGIELK